ncbi:MAG: SUMF1/EgtB/PvdO family nonheme iron enzyme [Planctomycetota bacterium]
MTQASPNRHALPSPLIAVLASLVLAAGGVVRAAESRSTIAAPVFGGEPGAQDAPVAPKDSAPQPVKPALPEGMKPYDITIPGTEVVIRMVPVPHPERPYWLSATEVTWDAFDEFVFEDMFRPEDFAKMKGPDAVARPSKPYIPPDRGFGHEGFPAISLRYQSAKNFCTWLGKKTGTPIRLPGEDEWEYACLAGAKGPYAFDPKEAKKHAWFYEHSLKRPVDPNEDPDFHERGSQPVGKLAANAWGLFDMHGNAAEWVDGRDGTAVLKGGSWQDDVEKLVVTGREAWRERWQMTDPQIPKSQWWLSDGPFAGMRLARSWKAPKADAAGSKGDAPGAKPEKEHEKVGEKKDPEEKKR